MATVPGSPRSSGPQSPTGDEDITQRSQLQGEFNPTVPTRRVFGKGKGDTLKDEVKALGGKRVLVRSGRSVAEKTNSVRRFAGTLGSIAADQAVLANYRWR